MAYAAETFLWAVSTSDHAGGQPAGGSFFQVEPQEFVISAIKTTENEVGRVIRGYNISDKEITARLKTLQLFSQFEIANLSEETIYPLQFTRDITITLTAGENRIMPIILKE